MRVLGWYKHSFRPDNRLMWTAVVVMVCSAQINADAKAQAPESLIWKWTGIVGLKVSKGCSDCQL